MGSALVSHLLKGSIEGSAAGSSVACELQVLWCSGFLH